MGPELEEITADIGKPFNTPPESLKSIASREVLIYLTNSTNPSRAMENNKNFAAAPDVTPQS